MLNKVIEILAEKLDKDASEITAESSIKEDLGADSLDMVEIGMAIEDIFEVEVTDKDVEKISTVQDVVNFVCEKKK